MSARRGLYINVNPTFSEKTSIQKYILTCFLTWLLTRYINSHCSTPLTKYHVFRERQVGLLGGSKVATYLLQRGYWPLRQLKGYFFPPRSHQYFGLNKKESCTGCASQTNSSLGMRVFTLNSHASCSDISTIVRQKKLFTRSSKKRSKLRNSSQTVYFANKQPDFSDVIHRRALRLAHRDECAAHGKIY